MHLLVMVCETILHHWSPMIFAALAVVVALQTGLFNICVSGQMLVAGTLSIAVVSLGSYSGPVARLLVVLLSLVLGAIVGMFIGWLKSRYHVNEVVSSIMLNYVIQYVSAVWIPNYDIQSLWNASRYDLIRDILFAFFMVWLISFLFRKTTLGYELKMVSSNHKVAQYMGISVETNMVVAMLISGALAGLAGATYYLESPHFLQGNELPNMGYDAIAVALLGRVRPMGVVFSSFLISLLRKWSGVYADISSILISFILLFGACSGGGKYDR